MKCWLNFCEFVKDKQEEGIESENNYLIPLKLPTFDPRMNKCYFSVCKDAQVGEKEFMPAF